jgi:hypothetical protein
VGLILRVGKKRRSWQYRYHAGGSYHRKPLGHFPAMELGDARTAAREMIERADKGIRVETQAPHPRGRISNPRSSVELEPGLGVPQTEHSGEPASRRLARNIGDGGLPAQHAFPDVAADGSEA